MTTVNLDGIRDDPVPFGRVGVLDPSNIVRDARPESGVRSIYDANVVGNTLIVVQHNYHEIESFHGGREVMEAAGEGNASYWVAYDGSVIPSRLVGSFWEVNSLLHQIFVEHERSHAGYHRILQSSNIAEARALLSQLRNALPIINHF